MGVSLGYGSGKKGRRGIGDGGERARERGRKGTIVQGRIKEKKRTEQKTHQR